MRRNTTTLITYEDSMSTHDTKSLTDLAAFEAQRDRKALKEAEKLPKAYTARPLAYLRYRLPPIGSAFKKLLQGEIITRDESLLSGIAGPPEELGDWVYTSDGWRRPTPTEAYRVALGEEPW